MTNKSITYHRATLNDAETLAGLRVDFLLALLRPKSVEEIAVLKDNLLVYFKSALSNEDCLFYVAKANSVIVGVGGASFRLQPGNFKNPSGRVAYILNMYTVPGFRKLGICKTILQMIVHEANQMGISAFELHATKEGEQIYIKNGFQLHNEPTYRRYTNVQ